ncbi:Vitamin B6 biosynthesis protein [Macleaya cordata]|uniref:Vitamin B6 biosynthesis protein n=1 Tax=Macleaya cordata TaxID=56857 RepID=A0A200PP16_MACCD|nr:Vitamin B6 biosynthesis protein [Macleaya cordata]
MADDSILAVYNNTAITDPKQNPFSTKVGRAQMLRGGAIIEVLNPEQAKLAEEAGACAISISSESKQGGAVSRMADPSLIKQIKQSVSIPVIAKSRIGHFVEAQILESIGVDYIDESENLTPADDQHYINKRNFRVPFVCGCEGLGEALRRIREGAALIRTQGDLMGTGNIVDLVGNVRSVMGEIRVLNNMDDDEVFSFAKKISAPYDLVVQTKQLGRLPVVHFAAGGIVTPADAALMMQLGCDGVFVGSEIFMNSDPYKSVRSVVRAVMHYNDPHVLAETSSGLTESMAGLNLNEEDTTLEEETFETRDMIDPQVS